MIHEVSLAFPKHQSQQKLKPVGLSCPLSQTFCDQTRRPRASVPPGSSHCSRCPLPLTCLVLGLHVSLTLMRGSAHCWSLHCSILHTLAPLSALLTEHPILSIAVKAFWPFVCLFIFIFFLLGLKHWPRSTGILLSSRNSFYKVFFWKKKKDLAFKIRDCTFSCR